MKYFYIDGSYIPKHCIYGPRPREAIFLNNWEWYGVVDHLYKYEREREINDAYIAKEQSKKEKSSNMTKNWQNTLASIKSQSEKRRIEKREKMQKDKIDEYNKILESWKEEKKPVMTKARKTLFEAKDAVKTIVSAMNQCMVITEWEKQIKFKKFLKEERAKKEALYNENMMLKNADDYEANEKIRITEKKNNFRTALLEQIADKRKKCEEAERNEREAVKEDFRIMNKVNEKLKKCEEKQKLCERKCKKMSLEMGYHALQLKKMKELEEEEETEINAMINKYKRRFEKERKKKEVDLINESIERRQKMTDELTKNMLTAMKKEDELLGKALQEREEAEARREKEKQEVAVKARAEMEEWAEVEKARIAAEIHSQKEAVKWKLLQNERKAEIDAAWSKELIRKKKEIQNKTSENYAMQIKERLVEEEEARRRDSVFEEKANANDEEVEKYYENALEYVRSRQWNDYPLLTAMTKIRKEYATERERTLASENNTNGTEEQTCRRTKNISGINACYCFKN